MLIGIISEHTDEKKSIFNIFKRKYKVEKIDACGLPCELVAVRIRCHSKEKSVQICREIEAAAIKLRESGAKRIVLSEYLKKYKSGLSKIFSEGSSEFYRCFPDCVRVVAKKCGLNLLNTEICIRADKVDRISEYLLHSLCYDTKKLAIFTSDTLGAETLCDRFCEDTGLSVRILPNMDANAEILIDVDKITVKFGNSILVDGIEFDFEIEEYSVDILDIMACLKGFDWVSRIKSYKDRKNRLTLFKN